jgi:cytochrome c556
MTNDYTAHKERLREQEAARAMLAALKAAQTPVIQAFEHYQAAGNTEAASGVWSTLRNVRAAIAQAEAAGIKAEG